MMIPSLTHSSFRLWILSVGKTC